MTETKGFKMQNQEQAATALAEEALDVFIKNGYRYDFPIKALRLTCKSTKVAADAKVEHFTLSLEQEPGDVQSSGLLNSITKLFISFNFGPLGDADDHAQKLARALGLLRLAVGVCGKSLKVLRVHINASFETLLACTGIISNYTWGSLEQLSIQSFSYPMPDFLSAVNINPGCFPALKELICGDLSSSDIESVCNSVFVCNLTGLFMHWSAPFESGTATPIIAAMRSLLEKATKVETSYLTSSSFDFFNGENLVLPNLKSLELKSSASPAIGDVDFAAVLALPWPMLESLNIQYAVLKGSDLVRIFEAEDTLPVLNELVLFNCGFVLGDAELSCVRRPQLEEFNVEQSTDGHVLISKLAQAMKGDRYALPGLLSFYFDCENENPVASAIEALSEFLQCPCAAELETLKIAKADLSINGTGLLHDIVNFCPDLRVLYLDLQNLGSTGVALLLGFGMMGAWPELQHLGFGMMGAWPELAHLGGILEEGNDHAAPNSIHDEHLYMPRIDVEEILRRVWPGLDCW